MAFFFAHAGSLVATDGVDYTGLGSQEVVFEDGDMTPRTFVIELTDDTDPELAEQFTVVLSNPPGGSALIDPESVSLNSHPKCYHCTGCQLVLY